MQISFVMLIFYCFRTKFRGGAKVSEEGQTASGGGLLLPCGRKPELKKLEFMRMLENSMSFEGVRWRVSGIDEGVGGMWLKLVSL